jgi:hypothetical protein
MVDFEELYGVFFAPNQHREHHLDAGRTLALLEALVNDHSMVEVNKHLLDVVFRQVQLVVKLNTVLGRHMQTHMQAYLIFNCSVNLVSLLQLHHLILNGFKRDHEFIKRVNTLDSVNEPQNHLVVVANSLERFIVVLLMIDRDVFLNFNEIADIFHFCLLRVNVCILSVLLIYLLQGLLHRQELVHLNRVVLGHFFF